MLPTTINGQKYISGLITDSIPLKKSVADRNNKNIVIITQNKEYFTNTSDYFDIATFRYSKYSGMKSALKNTYNNFLKSYDYLYEESQNGNAFVIEMPKELILSNTDSNRLALTKSYICGSQIARENLKKLCAFLSTV